jgi:hypothetical protein
MKVIVLNGPMGVGKTTIGTAVADMCPGTAFIDGDCCMDIHPFVGNKETREMAVDNILHMTENYMNCSVCNMVVIAWLMDDDSIRRILTDGLRKLNSDVRSYTLVCSEEQLRRQWDEDTSCPWRTEEWLKVSISSLEYFRSLGDMIDVEGMSVGQIARMIAERQ